jgi:hypothetical protein
VKIEVNLKDSIKFDKDQIKDFKIDVFDSNPPILTSEELKYDERVKKLEYSDSKSKTDSVDERTDQVPEFKSEQPKRAWPAMEKQASVMSTTSNSFTPSA